MKTLQSELLSIVVHELKNPITSLKLTAQLHLAKSKVCGSDNLTTREWEFIDHELNRMVQLVDDILDDVRIERRGLKIKVGTCEIVRLCEMIVSKTTALFPDHNIILAEKPHSNIKLMVDSNRIEQVIVNLISNAVKYAPKNSKINIKVKDLNTKVQISVQDYGIGIPQNKQRLVFDKYYQVNAAKSSGFGLGLYISKKIIKAHKGNIWVQSKLKRGSTFIFTLPKKASFKSVDTSTPTYPYISRKHSTIHSS